MEAAAAPLVGPWTVSVMPAFAVLVTGPTVSTLELLTLLRKIVRLAAVYAGPPRLRLLEPLKAKFPPMVIGLFAVAAMVPPLVLSMIPPLRRNAAWRRATELLMFNWPLLSVVRPLMARLWVPEVRVYGLETVIVVPLTFVITVPAGRPVPVTVSPTAMLVFEGTVKVLPLRVIVPVVATEVAP